MKFDVKKNKTNTVTFHHADNFLIVLILILETGLGIPQVDSTYNPVLPLGHLDPWK